MNTLIDELGSVDIDKQVMEFTIPFEVTGKQIVDLGTTIPELQKYIHEWAVRKEWRGPNAETQRTTGDDIALIVSEAAEALEAYRQYADPSRVWSSWSIELDGVKFKEMSRDQMRVLLDAEPDDDMDFLLEEAGAVHRWQGVAPELADVMIRVLDYCAEHNIDFLKWLLIVVSQNDDREIRHGGKHL
jgi:hypothetical protein